jgi:hypothetical protein
MRGESVRIDLAVPRRSEGEAKSTRADSPFLTNWNRKLRREKDPEGQPATEEVMRGAMNQIVATHAIVAQLLATAKQP